MLAMFLMMFGLVLFVLAGLGIPNPARFNFLSFGLACWILADIIAHVGPLSAGFTR